MSQIKNQDDVAVRPIRRHRCGARSLARRKASWSRDERLKFERLLVELSARFSSISEEEVDGEIELWLRRLVEHLDLNRSSFSEVTGEGIRITHTYATEGIEPQGKVVADRLLPWLVGQMNARRSVVLRRIPEDLPGEAELERSYFTSVGMRSGIALPISIAHSLICVISMSSFSGPRDWPAELVDRVRVVGEVFANALVRRRSKQQLEEKRKELAHVGRVAAMGQLASVMAHELDQPLTAIVSNAQAVRHLLECPDPDLPEIDAALKDVIDAGMRISEIVRRERKLLKKSEVCFLPLDLNEVVSEIEMFIRAEARREEVRLAFDFATGLPKVAGDRVQLQQVILNLARNGIQAMAGISKRHRMLKVCTQASRSEVRLDVIDAGPKIELQKLSRIFEPFYTTKEKGLGMGLSISKTIMDGHQGRIWPTPNAEGGLTMSISIPRNGDDDVSSDGSTSHGVRR